jgi:divalent anion:Na+ symporter, DASS family
MVLAASRPGASQSRDLWRWVVPPVTAAAVWLVPHPAFDARPWGLLCLFAATVAGLIVRPLPAGAVVLIAIAVAATLGLVPLQTALSGFANPTVWLIVAAFLFARGFAQTKLGERIAFAIIERFGSGALRLGYSILLADLAIAPLTPSNTARVGGILFPITLGVARGFGSEPGPTASRIGAFLMKTLYQGDLVVSAMFLTSMAANPLVAEMARHGSGVEITWALWALAAAVPGVIGLAVIPYVVHRLVPPTVRDTSGAQAFASERLRGMGPMGRAERVMLGVFGLVLVLWVTGQWNGLSPTTVAYVGLALLLLTRTLDWQDLLRETGAWDALIWFGGLVMLAGEIDRAGLTKAFASGASGLVAGWPWWLALSALLLVYLYAHYAFASMTAHVTAMFPAFFAVATGIGAPPLVAALALGYFSNINAAMTHYGTGPAPIIFGAGYLSQAAWWRVGLILSFVHVLIWLPIGLLWWKIIGLW